RIDRDETTRLVSPNLPQTVAALEYRVCDGTVRVPDVAQVEPRAERCGRHIGAAVLARHREVQKVLEAAVVHAALAGRSYHERGLCGQIIGLMQDELQLTG